MKSWARIVLFGTLFCLSVPSQAIDPYQSLDQDALFSNVMKTPNEKRESLFWAPIASYILPGINQYKNGQTGAALVYSGVGVSGLGLAFDAAGRLNSRGASEAEISDLDTFDADVRQFILGMKIYDTAGSLSLYHTFQTNVRFAKQKGEFAFLPEEAETTDELMLAPFEFSNMARWTTIVPLVSALGLMIYDGATNNRVTRSRLNGGDLLFSTTVSYGAGVGEEALFRGWAFPMLVESYGESNAAWANLTQAIIFGGLHYSDENQLPIAQTMLGFYWGWLAQRNGWSLRESIFIHTWWDIIIFTAAFTQGDEKASIYVPLYQTQF